MSRRYLLNTIECALAPGYDRKGVNGAPSTGNGNREKDEEFAETSHENKRINQPAS